MPHLSPQTLTEGEQRRLPRATAAHPRDHLVFCLALGTDLLTPRFTCRERGLLQKHLRDNNLAPQDRQLARERSEAVRGKRLSGRA